MEILGTNILGDLQLDSGDLTLYGLLVSSSLGTITQVGGDKFVAISGINISSASGTLYTTNAQITNIWVESLGNSNAVPNADVTTIWVESLQNSTAVPNANVTDIWIEYLYKPTTTVRVTSEYTEVISYPTSTNASVTQGYAEVISNPDPNASITQEYSEVLSERKNWALVTQQYIETISNNWISTFPARVSCEYAEILHSQGIIVTPRLLVTEEYAEIIRETKTVTAVSQEYTEVLNIPLYTYGSVSSLFAEVIRKTKGTGSIVNTNVHM